MSGVLNLEAALTAEFVQRIEGTIVEVRQLTASDENFSRLLAAGVRLISAASRLRDVG